MKNTDQMAGYEVGLKKGLMRCRITHRLVDREPPAYLHHPKNKTRMDDWVDGYHSGLRRRGEIHQQRRRAIPCA